MDFDRFSLLVFSSKLRYFRTNQLGRDDRLSIRGRICVHSESYLPVLQIVLTMRQRREEVATLVHAMRFARSANILYCTPYAL